MAAEKQLIVAVEGTAALGPYWNTILSGCLDKIVRRFHGEANPELAMVVFGSHGPYSDFVVQRSGWTRDLDVFLHWLSGLQLTGGGFSDAAIAEGLSEALMMFGSQSDRNMEMKRHCILVAASNPHPLPTPVYRPCIASSEQKPEAYLANAEDVARSLGQCSVSLSVISPRQFPNLREVYNAARSVPELPNPVVVLAENPNFLVLVSRDFMQAQVALNCASIGNPSVASGAQSEQGEIGNNNSTQNVPPAQNRLEKNIYIPIWEGELYGNNLGKPVLICKLLGYRTTTTSETIAANWPQQMHIAHVLTLDHMNNKQFVGEAEKVIFRIVSSYISLKQLGEQKQCAVVKLPSQTLLLSVSDKESCLIGMVLLGSREFQRKEPSKQQQQHRVPSGTRQQQQQKVGLGRNKSGGENKKP